VPRHARAISKLLFVLSVLGDVYASPARAEPGASELLEEVVWDAPAACPETSEIRSKINALLGHGGSRREPVAARASVSAAGTGFTAHIELRVSGGSESKVLHADDCATLADAYALIVAFVLDPSAGQAGGTSVQSDPQPASAAASQRPSSREPTRGARRLGARRFVLGAAAVGALGVGQLPFPGLGAGARLNAGRYVYGELGALYWPARDQSISTPEGTAGAEVSLVTAESALCVPVIRETLAVCLGMGAGSIRARGTGVAHPADDRSVWVSAGAAVTTVLPISGRFALRFRLALGAPFNRPRFVLNELGPEEETRTAFRPEPLFGTFSLEPELRFFSTDSRRGGHGRR
jgi:hypothetical protein